MLRTSQQNIVLFHPEPENRGHSVWLVVLIPRGGILQELFSSSPPFPISFQWVCNTFKRAKNVLKKKSILMPYLSRLTPFDLHSSYS